jgi:hypothetical protein
VEKDGEATAELSFRVPAAPDYTRRTPQRESLLLALAIGSWHLKKLRDHGQQRTSDTHSRKTEMNLHCRFDYNFFIGAARTSASTRANPLLR